jgi:hypothetical protein
MFTFVLLNPAFRKGESKPNRRGQVKEKVRQEENKRKRPFSQFRNVQGLKLFTAPRVLRGGK